MQIERLQVEGGFLNGFDLRLKPGLNVLIGARGTGKTSVIELLRFVLGARSHTPESQKRSLEHACSTLDGGEVTATLDNVFDEITVSRNAEDDKPRSSSTFPPAIVLSQTEIETLGQSDDGRLNLLDAFVSDRTATIEKEAALVSNIKSLYQELGNLEDEIERLSTGFTQRDALINQRLELQAQEKTYQSRTADVAEQQARLATLSASLSEIAVKEAAVVRFQSAAARWLNELRRLREADFGPEEWSGEASADPLAAMRKEYRASVEMVSKSASAFEVLHAKADTALRSLQGERSKVESSARPLRIELEQIAQGAGTVAKQIGSINTQIAELDARQKVVGEREARLKGLREKRDKAFEDLQATRRARTAGRILAAKQLTSGLAPSVKVEVEPLGRYGEYAKAITEALRGSGMKYNELSVTIAELVSQREIIDFVETNNFGGLADLIDIPKDRAARLLSHLSEAGIGDIVTCNIEDNVHMSLLDGVEYKGIGSLSAGQRCTVILSVVLKLRDRVLIIDQPEDHLDNAFITKTVIKALRERQPDEQVILSTHNANIPVLAEASLVVELTSDGRNGFIQIAENLEHPEVVSAITSVMEGGSEAFKARAAFYAKHQD